MLKVSRLLFLLLTVVILTLSCGDDKDGPTGPTDETHGITFVTIPGGTFQMGDVENEGHSDEKPVHTVTISSFEMSIYEVTNAQYAAYLSEVLALGDIEIHSGDVYGKTGEWAGHRYLNLGRELDTNNKCWIQYGSGSFTITTAKENWPVVAVTWYGAKVFAQYYSLDLPTEAEWEYACRAGTETYFYTGNNLSGNASTSTDLEEAGWYLNNSDTGGEYPWTHPVGQKTANAFGLYDMHGNVYEWCNDWYNESYYFSSPSNNPTGPTSGSYRVLRGGGWLGSAGHCRSGDRGGYSPDSPQSFIGFRVIRRP